MRQTSIKTKIPKFVLSINFETLKEKNSNPEDWAELLYKIKKYTDVSEEDPYEFFANIDHALFYIIMKGTPSVSYTMDKKEIEFKLEYNTLYIIIKYEQYFVVDAVDIEECWRRFLKKKERNFENQWFGHIDFPAKKVKSD